MAVHLSRTIERTFDTLERRTGYYRTQQPPSVVGVSEYMDIPITGNTFEVPMFAVNTLRDLIRTGKLSCTDTIAVALDSRGITTNYKSVDRYLQDVMICEFPDTRLIVLEAKRGTEIVPYFGTHGAIFDRDLQPVCMFLWRYNRVNENSIEPVRPVFRVNPYYYLYKNDNLSKYIINKMLATCIDTRISRLGNTFSVKIEIDNCPFHIHQAAVPDISTTNSQLLQIAKDHIDELLS